MDHNQERAAPASGPFIPRIAISIFLVIICKRGRPRFVQYSLTLVPAGDRLFVHVCLSVFRYHGSPFFHRVPFLRWWWMGDGDGKCDGWWNFWLALIRYRPKRNPAVLAASLTWHLLPEWSDFGRSRRCRRGRHSRRAPRGKRGQLLSLASGRELLPK
ncbi:hypothetical protein F5Y05DRAFT_50997 [Hypoxylon sp. FL0543]|nr:hypothetical protein F5Y05DRAFT_50997 [Hypoxylon sp. FL0543]